MESNAQYKVEDEYITLDFTLEDSARIMSLLASATDKPNATADNNAITDFANLLGSSQLCMSFIPPLNDASEQDIVSLKLSKAAGPDIQLTCKKLLPILSTACIMERKQPPDTIEPNPCLSQETNKMISENGLQYIGLSRDTYLLQKMDKLPPP